MPEDGVRVTVVFSPAPRKVQEWAVHLPHGATALQAVMASGLPDALAAFDASSMTAGIWGRRTPWGEVVREGDRVEVYRPLVVDPKVARRERFRKQGARAAGLFSKRRPGAKPGY